MRKILETIKRKYNEADFCYLFFDESNGRTAWATKILRLAIVIVSAIALLRTG